MKHRILKIALYQLRIAAVVMVLILPGILLVSAKAEKFYLQLWQQLGISKQESGGNIKETFMFGFIYHGGLQSIKHIISGDRVAVAKDLLEYTKTYVYGEEFRKDYSKYREQKKPVLHLLPPTEAIVRRKYIDVVKLQMKDVKRSIRNATEHTRKMYEDFYVLLKKQLKDFEDPQSKTMAYVMQNEQSLFDKAVAKYDQELAEWNRQYPEDRMQFIKLRLEAFLQSTADVDYTAGIIKIKGRKHFEKPAYDLKDDTWKYAHHAGKEVTETVREFVKGWIEEIEKV